MCVVSAVTGYYNDVFPQRFPNNPHPFGPQGDPEVTRLLREALERLDKIDKRLGDIECQDEIKAAFMKQVGLT